MAPLLKRLKDLFGPPPRRLASWAVPGRSFELAAGSFRAEVDYDDAWLLALSRQAEVVFDVGCNVGQSSLLILLGESVREVVAIEPNPEALSLCAEHLIRNRLSHKARFVCAFAAERSGDRVAFFTAGAGAAGSRFASHAKTAGKSDQQISVATVSLDQLGEELDRWPDLVKIDVEGAELETLRGSRLIAARGKTRFLVEMHANPELPMERNAAEVLQWCRETGYRAWYLKEGTPLDDPGPVAHRGRCHLLLLPAAESYPAILRGIEQGAPLEKAFTSS